MTGLSFDDAFGDAVRVQMLRLDAVLGALEEPSRSQLRSKLEDPTVPARRISKALRRMGITAGPHAVATWRERYGVR